jgi:hypothetical protein
MLKQMMVIITKKKKLRKQKELKNQGWKGIPDHLIPPEKEVTKQKGIKKEVRKRRKTKVR